MPACVSSYCSWLALTRVQLRICGCSGAVQGNTRFVAASAAETLPLTLRFSVGRHVRSFVQTAPLKSYTRDRLVWAPNEQFTRTMTTPLVPARVRVHA